MKAAVLEAFNAPLVIRDLELAEPAAFEVVVRTAAVGVCHSDLLAWEGFRPAMPLPAVLGHEVAGVVDQVGTGVTDLAPGDHVVGSLAVFCGTCAQCVSGRQVLCQDTSVKQPPGQARRIRDGARHISQNYNLGAFAERLLVHRNALVKIRRDMPLDRAALLGCAVTTGTGAVFRTAQVTPGSTVAVLGCGGVGLSAVNGARIAGASVIVAIDMSPRKEELARRFGATHFVDASAGDVVTAVKSLTGGGVDYAFECIGTAMTVEQCWSMLQPAGIATVLGAFGPTAKVSLGAADFLQEKQLRGSMLGSSRSSVDIPRLVELYMQGRLMLDELISQRIGLDGVNEALGLMKAGRGEIARSVIVF
jgi:S-(hydroxymethyl)glutathione dehydrogenase/alcohol dehydrogenase